MPSAPAAHHRAMNLPELRAERLRRWRQTEDTRVADPDQAASFIDACGICTLYGANPEFPSLYDGYMGQPDPPVSQSWDSPSGHVYTWRWALGHRKAAFYAAIVAKKPTYVSWPLLPTVLGALMDRRMPDELLDLGLISQNAHRIAVALDDGDGLLRTGELRKRAGLATGKESRAAYLKALEELEARLLVAKEFSGVEGDDDMIHAFVPLRYRDAVDQALNLTREEALERLLRESLEASCYIDAKPYSRALRIDLDLLLGVLPRVAEERTLDGQKVWLPKA